MSAHSKRSRLFGLCLLAVAAPPVQFDKLSKAVHNGLFHPSGHQLIVDSQVWDARTFKVAPRSLF